MVDFRFVFFYGSRQVPVVGVSSGLEVLPCLVDCLVGSDVSGEKSEYPVGLLRELGFSVGVTPSCVCVTSLCFCSLCWKSSGHVLPPIPRSSPPQMVLTFWAKASVNSRIKEPFRDRGYYTCPPALTPSSMMNGKREPINPPNPRGLPRVLRDANVRFHKYYNTIRLPTPFHPQSNRISSPYKFFSPRPRCTVNPRSRVSVPAVHVLRTI
ncbi:hypothetical protein VTK26DRAFT_6899 [Humicola hyalothermophila]